MSIICGIYFYRDLKEDEIIYVGQSKNIYQRHRQHFHESKYHDQPINRVLQNDPQRYVLEIERRCTPDELNRLEQDYIALLKPRFNFTPGGVFIPKHTKAKKYKNNLWKTWQCHYISHINQRRHRPFRLYYNGWYVPCGYFEEWFTVELVWNLIKEEENEIK